MNHPVWPEGGEDRLSNREAFEALRRFVQTHWAMRGSQPNELGDLAAFLSPARDDGGPLDPAMWSDWLAAIREVKRGSDPSGTA